jgi:hypothetical protein
LVHPTFLLSFSFMRLLLASILCIVWPWNQLLSHQKCMKLRNIM